MASLLRQIVAGPRSRHPEAGLDLCYVTSNIIATSGPSGTYPQRAYRNPLDQLVKFLDYKHGEDWAIWEFRAEGTGYPDSEVYGRVYHYPWPDHHPPPFRLVPLIMAGMRNWLGGVEGEKVLEGGGGQDLMVSEGKEASDIKEKGKKRVVVVHCKAGKGRSGTMACSYLISQEGWTMEDALARFTERRMRPGFGQGVSIPSQLRWVSYVDRWTKGGKVYVDSQVEVLEVHVWGLREGVKVQVEGFVDEGKTIKLFHVFSKKERLIVDPSKAGSGSTLGSRTNTSSSHQLSSPTTPSIVHPKTEGAQSTSTNDTPQTDPAAAESGGKAVIFKPSSRIVLPTSDINIDFERRNKASLGWTMVTAVAHVWFNTFFEGHGPENLNNIPSPNGVFEIEWDKMDGIKGSSRKGTRAFDKLAVIWQAYDGDGDGKADGEEVVKEPGVNSPVQQMRAADWKGGNEVLPEGTKNKNLGLRVEGSHSATASKASSFNDAVGSSGDSDSEVGVKTGGPAGDDLDIDVEKLPSPKVKPQLIEGRSADGSGFDTASSTTGQREVSRYVQLRWCGLCLLIHLEVVTSKQTSLRWLLKAWRSRIITS